MPRSTKAKYPARRARHVRAARHGAALLQCCCFAAWGLGTEHALAAADDTAPLAYDTTRDLAITGASTALAISLELLSPTISPRRCRWCDRDENGNDTLNGFDASVRRALRWSDPSEAHFTSNVFSYALAPLAGIGVGSLIAFHDEKLRYLPVDLLIVAEATMLSVNVNQGLKLAFARERPDVHARSPAERARLGSSGDNLSFYSGHTSVAFAIAAASGTVATLRGYRLAPLVWITGETLAVLSGYLRIAADRHYATDVIAGAVMGSLIGFSVTYFGHRPVKNGTLVAVSPAVTWSGITLSGVW